MRNRIEDLGRIRVLLENILDDNLWDLYGQRTKDFEDWFFAKKIDEQRDIIYKMAYSLSCTETKLYEMLSIAKGDEE
jgi:hypothetical protein